MLLWDLIILLHELVLELLVDLAQLLKLLFELIHLRGGLGLGGSTLERHSTLNGHRDVGAYDNRGVSDFLHQNWHDLILVGQHALIGQIVTQLADGWERFQSYILGLRYTEFSYLRIEDQRNAIHGHLNNRTLEAQQAFVLLLCMIYCIHHQTRYLASARGWWMAATPITWIRG